MSRLARYFGLDPRFSAMKDYRVAGRFKAREGWDEFTTTVSAENADVAVERAYATLGSRHGLKRTQIDIADVEEA